jgi:hypothetical protein
MVTIGLPVIAFTIVHDLDDGHGAWWCFPCVWLIAGLVYALVRA